jgi:hypothetical protein
VAFGKPAQAIVFRIGDFNGHRCHVRFSIVVNCGKGCVAGNVGAIPSRAGNQYLRVANAFVQ